jgi:hypothetical protein
MSEIPDDALAAARIVPPPDLRRLPRARLETMREAGAEALECMRVLANTGGNLVGELLRGVDTFYEWNHYPDGDVYDPASHGQYYYHAHPQELRSGEHGHFHTFMRGPGMPMDARPAPLADLVVPESPKDALSHLVAISMDAHGVPIRLFTTNRWVTGEIWYAAADVQAMLDRFEIDHAQPSWPVNRWIGAMLVLFRPQIRALIEARDEAVAAWAADRPGCNVFEDRGLEIASWADISMDDQMAAVAAALNSAPG